ncbi:MAG TPA: polyphenol oxidase family protein [Solirubrobacteraceae bacterium]|nr:polyphenol oxidase family protein [Solirubrobacteraceae bacterium]
MSDAALADGATAGELAFELPGARVLFTGTRAGNLSLHAGAGHARGLRRREELCERLALRWLCASAQVHGARVQRVRALEHQRGTPARVSADGHATALRGVGVMVLAADCLPVALAADGAVAMLHAGWRGLAAGVIEEGVRAVRELSPGGGTREHLVAVIGPGAGPCCYEVGAEVRRAFDGAHTHGRNIDLPAIARERLLAAGVADVRAVRACTICDPRFFSHRREGERAGRHAGVAWLSS